MNKSVIFGFVLVLIGAVILRSTGEQSAMWVGDVTMAFASGMFLCHWLLWRQGRSE